MITYPFCRYSCII